MAKDPAFLFYSSDFLTGTTTMSNEHVGMYVRLLCLQHQKGSLTEKDMIFICGSHVEDVFSKFTMKNNDGTFFNERLQLETEKRRQYSKSRSKNRLNGYKNQKHKRKIICKSYDYHMEDENEDENEDINENKNEDKILKRSESFKTEIKTFTQYPESMLQEFFDYWSEPNKSKTKMRYELQPTWDLLRRLNTWAGRAEMKKSPQRYGRQEVDANVLKKQAADFIEKRKKEEMEAKNGI
jgi:hypothetical protein